MTYLAKVELKNTNGKVKLFLNVGTPSGVHLFDHLLWLVFQVSEQECTWSPTGPPNCVESRFYAATVQIQNNISFVVRDIRTPDLP